MIEVQPSDVGGVENSNRGRDSVTLAWVLAVLLIHRRFILLVTLAGLLLSALGAVLRAPTYSATFSFTPQTGQDQSRSGLASLAGQFGISVPPSGQNPQLYADLLTGRGVLGPLLRDSFALSAAESRRTDLAHYFGIEAADQGRRDELTLRVLREHVISASVAARTTGVVGVSVRTRSPEISYEIARRLLDGLNRFNVATRKSQAGEERRFAEERLAAAKTALRVAEDALQTFLSANRQFDNSPQLNFQRERLQREVTLQQQLVVGLAQQYEEARIREVRDTPVITVIEEPVVPALPDPRGRVVIVLLGTFVALALAIALVLIREGWERQRAAEADDPSYALLERQWRSLRRRFRTA